MNATTLPFSVFRRTSCSSGAEPIPTAPRHSRQRWCPYSRATTGMLKSTPCTRAWLDCSKSSGTVKTCFKPLEATSTRTAAGAHQRGTSRSTRRLCQCCVTNIHLRGYDVGPRRPCVGLPPRAKESVPRKMNGQPAMTPSPHRIGTSSNIQRLATSHLGRRQGRDAEAYE